MRETPISFEIEPPDAAEMARRIATITARYPYIAAERDGAIIGYAYATELYSRAAYRWAPEATIYLTREAQGSGAGRTLYQRLIEQLKARGFQTVLGKITLPNLPSIGLHERLGFRRVGQFEKVGYKFGIWHDIAIYQLDLGERAEVPREPFN